MYEHREKAVAIYESVFGRMPVPGGSCTIYMRDTDSGSIDITVVSIGSRATVSVLYDGSVVLTSYDRHGVPESWVLDPDDLGAAAKRTLAAVGLG